MLLIRFETQGKDALSAGEQGLAVCNDEVDYTKRFGDPGAYRRTSVVARGPAVIQFLLNLVESKEEVMALYPQIKPNMFNGMVPAARRAVRPAVEMCEAV